MKRFCECGNRIKVFRRVRTRGKWRGKIKIFSDRRHDLCARCNNREFQRVRAEEIKEIVKDRSGEQSLIENIETARTAIGTVSNSESKADEILNTFRRNRSTQRGGDY